MQAACVRFLLCPVCGAAMEAAAAALRCAAGHAFDLARDGYANLLVTRRRRTRMVGDTPAMVAARASFLARGHYARLADELGGLVARHLRSRGRPEPGCIVDVGCGTGYYLGRLRDRLLADGVAPPCLFGTDVSKHAVRRAARAHPDATFLVADTRAGIPLAAHSAVAVLDVFAPREGAELARLLAPDGLLVVVTPGPAHLAELADRVGLVGIQPEKQRAVADGLAPWFRPRQARRLRYAVELTGPEAAELARMGPSAWHLTSAALADAERLDRLTVTADFRLAAYAPANEARRRDAGRPGPRR
jgi:23S rRNA (guanine745-N1)-methyltransferase